MSHALRATAERRAAHVAALLGVLALPLGAALPAAAESPAPVELPQFENDRVAGEFIVMTSPGITPESLEGAWAVLGAEIRPDRHGGTLMLVTIPGEHDPGHIMAMMRATVGVTAVEPNFIYRPMPMPEMVGAPTETPSLVLPTTDIPGDGGAAEDGGAALESLQNSLEGAGHTNMPVE